MAPKTSERLKKKTFKTKTSEKPLVIHDNSSDSTEDSSEPAMEENPSSPESDSVIGSERTSKRKRVSSSSKGKGKVPQEPSSSGKSAKRKSKPRAVQSPKPSVTKSLGRKKNEVCPCSFVDFNFFTSNGFYWNELLEPIGCMELCSIQVLVYGECVRIL